jgi:hypothetical protein
MHWRKENERLRPLAISLAKNNKVFHKLPSNTLGLVSWYENISAKILKKTKTRRLPRPRTGKKRR